MQSCFAPRFGQFIILVISNDVCVGFDFADGDILVGGFNVFTVRVMKSLNGWL